MFKISGGGVHSNHSSIYVLRNNGFPDYTLLLTNTSAQFTINQTQQNVSAHSIAIIDKHTPYTYFNPEGNYSDDWVYFNCYDEQWIKKISPMLNQFFTIPEGILIKNYMNELIWERNLEENNVGVENSELLLQVLLNNFISISQNNPNNENDNPYFYTFKKIRMDIRNHPELDYSPEAIANTMSISLSHFQHLYKNFFGQSLKTDIIINRVTKARHLIATSNLTISEIAEICGYKNDVHFYRQFKSITGTSPREYQRQEQKFSTKILEYTKNE